MKCKTDEAEIDLGNYADIYLELNSGQVCRIVIDYESEGSNEIRFYNGSDTPAWRKELPLDPVDYTVVWHDEGQGIVDLITATSPEEAVKLVCEERGIESITDPVVFLGHLLAQN